MNIHELFAGRRLDKRASTYDTVHFFELVLTKLGLKQLT